MGDIIRKIDLHVKLETVECTSMFFEQYEFPSKYSIIKINENVFGIVNNETNVCKITFTQIFITMVLQKCDLYLICRSFVFPDLLAVSCPNILFESKFDIAE